MPKSQIRTKRGEGEGKTERERYGKLGLRNRAERAISNPGMS